MADNHPHADIPNFSKKADPNTSAFLELVRSRSDEFGHAIVNSKTGEVFTNTGPGGSYERAHTQVREQITGVPHRDPAGIDLVIPTAALRDPILRADHAAKVRSMLLYLLDYYRPNLRRHPDLHAAVEHAAASLGQQQATLIALPDAYARWDLILDSVFERLDKAPRKRKH